MTNEEPADLNLPIFKMEPKDPKPLSTKGYLDFLEFGFSITTRSSIKNQKKSAPPVNVPFKIL